MGADRKDFIKQYDAINEKRHELKELQKQIEVDLLQYRIDSVNRILDFIRFKNLPKDKLDNYLVHCMNKLNGNIDGIELYLKDSDEDF